MLIKRIYQADPLRCPKCGGAMRIVAVIEAHQGDVIRKILQHCGLWKDPPPRGPPRRTRPSQAGRPTHDADGGITYEVESKTGTGSPAGRRSACGGPQAEDVPVPAFDALG